MCTLFELETRLALSDGIRELRLDFGFHSLAYNSKAISEWRKAQLGERYG